MNKKMYILLLISLVISPFLQAEWEFAEERKPTWRKPITTILVLSALGAGTYFAGRNNLHGERGAKGRKGPCGACVQGPRGRAGEAGSAFSIPLGLDSLSLTFALQLTQGDSSPGTGSYKVIITKPDQSFIETGPFAIGPSQNTIAIAPSQIGNYEVFFIIYPSGGQALPLTIAPLSSASFLINGTSVETANFIVSGPVIDGFSTHFIFAYTGFATP